MTNPTVVSFDISKQLSIVKEQKQGINKVYFKTKMSVEG